ncbi:ABC transporter permease [Achromobacter sp. SD115]|uniref:ABC transporter permease n=1 Tax=Achromobacter sp. SD115 TaxID=2782011 RepID=UPI001A95C26F|nr:ABC transporter permease [Achromobacter sp. SD115]MBO1015726.1 ABC transporter permease [Achromobacter sp. SD115]
MKKLAYLMRRVVQGLLVLALIAVINFLLIRAAPGDPATVMAGEAGAADEVFMAQLRERFGLDKPLPQQLANYLGHAARLDLGESYRQQRPVMSLIAERLPATLLLTMTAFVISLSAGVALGAWTSARAGTWVDSLVSTLSMLFYATPLFWLALMAVLLFSVKLEWLPGFGFETVGAGYSGLARAADIARHLALPAATLALFYMAVYARMTRTSMLEVAQMDFVKTARAKGLSPRRIQRHHILRNALLPVITLAGIQAGSMVGGTVLIETVFAWPGIGRLMFDALVQRDYNLLLGTFLITAALAVAFNIVTDLLYTLADPRIELQ